jgi:glucosamine-6-phosphate deaminase
MARKLSHIAPDWWDYSTLDASLIQDAARLTERDLRQLSRPGFKVVMHDTLEEFYLAQAMEYLHAWRQSTADNPTGICGQVGPTEHFPLIARLINELGLMIKDAHYWGAGEWVDAETKKEVGIEHSLSHERAARDLCFDRMQKKLMMPDAQIHFPKADTTAYGKSWHAGVRCIVMQTGQADIKTWAFNEPLKRAGKHKNDPATAADYRKLTTRLVDLHPVTQAQAARTSAGGNISLVPRMAVTVGPKETWLAEKISTWQAGKHDNPLGQRLTALMISKRIVDTSVPMSLLADHSNVQFNYYRGGIGECLIEMH